MSSHTRSLKRWTIILGTSLGILACAMIYIIWSDGQAKRTAPVANAEASTIRIHRDGFDDIQLAKTTGQWHLESPCKLFANEQRLSPLLSALTPGAHQYSSGEVDLQAAGLLSPKAIIYINDVEHRIGNTDLDGQRRYVQRGDVVEFIPEWVLSLVNGGVTALARLEIFTEPLSTLTLTDESGISRKLTLPDELAKWQTITAQQISTWPLPVVELSTPYQLQTSDSGGATRSFSVYQNDSLTAIRLDGAQCAYILSADALPK